MELSEIKPELIAHEIRHPKTGDNIGIRVHVLPVTDPTIKKIGRQIQDRKNYLAQRGKILSAEEMEAFSVELVCAAVTDWEWYGEVTFHNSQPEFSQANLKRVCSELDWFRAEIDEVLGDSKRFF